MTERIVKLIKDNNRLYIETSKDDGTRWCAYVKIHTENNALKKHICDFTLNSNFSTQEVIQEYIDCEIVKKIQTQYDDYYDNLPINIKNAQDNFSCYDMLHMTKLEIVLVDGNKIGMFIGEIYDSRYIDSQRLEHSGGDCIL